MTTSYEGFVSKIANDEIYIKKNTYGINEGKTESSDIVPWLPVNKRIAYDQAIMTKAIQHGMVILLQYKGTTGDSFDTSADGHERLVQPLNLGVNKNTKNELIRGWHMEGFSVKNAQNTTKVWRLFNAENIISMMFTGMFFRLPPSGYKMNDRVMTQHTICHADFMTIRKNQELLVKADKITKQEDITIGKPESYITVNIVVKETGKTINLKSPWDNDVMKPFKGNKKSVKITFLKTVLGDKYIAIIGASGAKNKMVKVFDDKKLIGSFKTIEATDGEALKKFKNIDGKEEMDICVFIKKK